MFYYENILLVTKGTKQEQLNKDIFAIEGENGFIAESKIGWLGFMLTSSGISPINSKTEGL